MERSWSQKIQLSHLLGPVGRSLQASRFSSITRTLYFNEKKENYLDRSSLISLGQSPWIYLYLPHIL